MSDLADARCDERVLVLVATSGDATLTRLFLEQAGLACALCGSLAELCGELSTGVGAILVNEEALSGQGSAQLARALSVQPVWSDVPVLLLTRHGADTEAVARAMTTLSTVTVLERPVRVVTLVSALRTALEARRRQYEIRDHVRALAESEASYRAMFDATTVGVVETDASGRFTRVNAAMCRLTGYHEKELLGRNYADVMYPEDQIAGAETLRRLLSGEIASFEAENRCLRKDGGTLWAHIAVNAIRGAEGRPLRNTAVILDITERKAAEEGLRASEQRLRAFLDNSSVIAWLKDEQGGYVYLSENFARRFGARLGEWRGRTDFEIWPREIAEEFYRNDQAVLAAGGSLEVIERTPDQAGDVAWWLNHKFTFHDAAGRRYVGGLGVDITARRQAEEALKEADRRKDEFLAVLGHELRNPLVPIRTGLELLRVAEPDSEVAERARQMMERQVRHMVRLIDDLVDVARITRGAITLRKERVDFAHVVEHAVEESRTAIEGARHELSISLPDDPIPVLGDPARLSQVMSNVLVNAARYTPPGGRIAIAGRREHGWVVVAVTDNGIGIPGEMLEKIFDLFTQVDAGISRSQGGLGIGLGLARRFAELHGGTIEARSGGPGKGSTFTVRLPIAEGEGLESLPSADYSVQAGRPLRILVVDDEHDVANTTGMLLRLMGHEIRIAHDGPSVLEAVHGAQPDVVLLDLGLPGMDGYAVARALRERTGKADVPIVAVSGFGRDIDLQESKELGFFAHLVKPYEPEALGRVLASLAARVPESA